MAVGGKYLIKIESHKWGELNGYHGDIIISYYYKFSFLEVTASLITIVVTFPYLMKSKTLHCKCYRIMKYLKLAHDSQHVY